MIVYSISPQFLPADAWCELDLPSDQLLEISSAIHLGHLKEPPSQVVAIQRGGRYWRDLFSLSFPLMGASERWRCVVEDNGLTGLHFIPAKIKDRGLERWAVMVKGRSQGFTRLSDSQVDRSILGRAGGNARVLVSGGENAIMEADFATIDGIWTVLCTEHAATTLMREFPRIMFEEIVTA